VTVIIAPRGMVYCGLDKKKYDKNRVSREHTARTKRDAAKGEREENMISSVAVYINV